MKKSFKIILSSFTIIVILLTIFIVLKCNSKERIVNDKDYLYEKVEQYLISQEQPQYFLETKDSEPNYNVSDFKVFTDIAKLGVRQNKDETYIYVWALVESYYVQDNKLIHNRGSSAPYKFIIKNDKIVDYKERDKLNQNIFPNDIKNKLDDSLVNINDIKKQVEEHYSYLSSENLIHEIDLNNEMINKI